MIAIPRAKLIKISDLKTDGKNPNRMTVKQLAALSENIKRYGFLVPVITNEDLLVADGEQRINAAQDLGMEKVPVIVLPMKEVDRLIIRQVMNKLRGEHEEAADYEEFKRIMDMGGFDEFASLMALTGKETNQILDFFRNAGEDGFDAGSALKNSSDENDTILDLFGGSGSTLIACEQTGRSCRIMEIDPTYCSVIIERWESLTKKKGTEIGVKNHEIMSSESASGGA